MPTSVGVTRPHGGALRVLACRSASSPALLALGASPFLGLHARRPTVSFVGWFGPRGLASIVFAIIVLEGSALNHADIVVASVLITVALSVYAHGLTARPVTDAYARWFAARAEPPAMESTAAHEHRWRRPAAVVAPEFRAPTSTGA